ncbi:hypothetical protein J2X68_007498 [Streptomyces sp. 3330]|nr:hypothetical protein [Streptomyces sp. 3330]
MPASVSQIRLCRPRATYYRGTLTGNGHVRDVTGFPHNPSGPACGAMSSGPVTVRRKAGGGYGLLLAADGRPERRCGRQPARGGAEGTPWGCRGRCGAHYRRSQVGERGRRWAGPGSAIGGSRLPRAAEEVAASHCSRRSGAQALRRSGAQECCAAAFRPEDGGPAATRTECLASRPARTRSLPATGCRAAADRPAVVCSSGTRAQRRGRARAGVSQALRGRGAAVSVSCGSPAGAVPPRAGPPQAGPPLPALLRKRVRGLRRV